MKDSFTASHWLEALKATTAGDRNWEKAVAALTELGLPAAPVLIEAMGTITGRFVSGPITPCTGSVCRSSRS